MSLFWCRPREAMVDEVVAADADARARCAGSYSAWMRKAKSDQAKAKWLCSSTKRYFTIDFDSQIFFYSHAEGAKRISHPIRFKEITGAEQIPMAAKRSSGGQGCGFLLKTTERTFELHTASNTDAVQWITALNAAKEMGSVADLGFKSGRESPAETVNSTASTMISPHTPSVEEDAPIFGTQDDRSGSPPPPPEPRAEPAPPSPAGVEPPLARPALPRRPAPLPGRPAEAAPTAEPTAARAGPAAQPPARAAPPDVAEAPAAAPTAAPSAPAAPAAPLAASPQEPPTPAVPAAAAPAPSMAAPAEVSAATRRMAAAVANMQIPTVSAAAVLPAPKKQAEQLQDDGPGTYRIISAGPLKALPVSKDYARTSAKVGEVAVQQEVSVLEVAAELNDGRRRARIGGPAGWITLLDTNSGFRFALKQSDALAEPVPTAAAASAPPAPEKEAAAPAGPPARACPDGHPLAPLLTPGAGQCDGCQAEVPAGAEVLECGTCNWWLCRACAPREAPGSQVAPPAEAAPQPALRVTRSGAKRLPRLASPAPISEDSPRPASALAGKRSADSPSPLLKKTVSFDEKEDVRQIAARGEESPYSPTTDEQLAQEAEASQAPLPPPPPAPTGAGAAPQPPQEEAGQPEAALRITRPNVNVKRLPKLGGHLPRSPRRDSPLPSPPQAPAVGAPAAAGEPAELEGAEPSGWDSDEERPRRRSPSPAADASAEEQKMVIPEGPAVAMEIADPSGFDSDDAPQEKPVVTLARPASASKGGLAMEFDMGGPKAAVPKALAERLSRKAPAKRSGGKAGRIDPTRPADARKAALARRPAPAEAVSEGAAASSEEPAPVAAPTAALQATAAPAAPAPAEEPPASAAPAADAPAASTAAPAEVSAATQRMAAAVANMQIPTVSAASALPAPKKQAEQAQDDSPGTYRVISAGPLKALPVSEDYARTSAKVGEVAVQQEVSVLEVAAELNDGRRRARIGGPAGWITLLDTNSGFRFAMKQSDTLAEPAPPGEPAVKPAGMATPGGAAVNPAGMAPPGGAAVKLAGMAPPGGAAVKPAGMAPPGGAAVKPAGMAPPGGAAVKPAGMAPPGGAAVKPAGMAPPAGAAVKPAGMAPPAGAAVKPAGMAPPAGAAVKPAGMAPAAAEASAPPVPE